MMIHPASKTELDPRTKSDLDPVHSSGRSLREPLLTIFAVPKPFGGAVDVIQRNAIRSWVRLRPWVDVLLIGDEAGIKETAEQLGVRHAVGLQRNEFGTPLLSSAFEIAHRESSSPMLVYCNCDLILLSDFVQSMLRIAESNFAEFVAFGRRIDLTVNDEIEFDEVQAVEALISRCRLQGKNSSVVCKDFFAFSRELYRDIPDFAVGRGNWDNWMIHAAKHQKRVPVINISDVATVIHQAHDYSHIRQSRMSCYVTGREAQQNQRLAGGRYLVNGSTATWRMDKHGLRRVKLNRLNLSFWRDVPRFLKLLSNLVSIR